MKFWELIEMRSKTVIHETETLVISFETRQRPSKPCLVKVMPPTAKLLSLDDTQIRVDFLPIQSTVLLVHYVSTSFTTGYLIKIAKIIVDDEKFQN